MNVVAAELTNTTATLVGDVVPEWLTKSSLFPIFLSSVVMSSVMAIMAAIGSVFYYIWAWLKRRFWIVVEIHESSQLYDPVSYALAVCKEMEDSSITHAVMTTDRYTAKYTVDYICDKRNYIWRQIDSQPLCIQFKGRRIWVTHNSSSRKYVFECYGINKEFLKDLIAEFAAKYKNSNRTTSNIRIDALSETSDGLRWINLMTKTARPMSSVIVPDEMKQKIETDIDWFVSNLSWYTKRGIPYRRGYLLYGPPGTGKSSFVNAIAGRAKLNVYIVNLATPKMTDHQLNEKLSSLTGRGIVLLEDIDAAFGSSDPDSNDDAARKAKTGVTASGLLNALDGVAAQEGKIVIMTTNHKDKLDPALIRPGRVDMTFHFGLATKDAARRLFIQFYEDSTDADAFADAVPNEVFSMAELQGHLMCYQSDPKQAVAAMPAFVAAKK